MVIVGHFFFVLAVFLFGPFFSHHWHASPTVIGYIKMTKCVCGAKGREVSPMRVSCSPALCVSSLLLLLLLLLCAGDWLVVLVSFCFFSFHF